VKARGIGRLYRLKYKHHGEVREAAIWWIAFGCRRTCGRQACTGRHEESSHSDNRRVAEKLLRQRLGEIGLGKLSSPDVEKTHFEDLAMLIAHDYVANGRKSSTRLGHTLTHLRETFGTCRALAITTDKVTAYIAARLQAKAAAATVSHELAALKRMFTLALQAGKVAGRPHIPSLHISNARQGFFEEPEFRAVLVHLPDYLRPPMTFCYLTGWRRSEVLSLTWAQVDFRAQEVRLEPGTTKNDDGRTFPFGAYAPLRDLIYAQRARTAKDCPWVFHHDGRRILDYRAAWRTACLAAGLPGKLVHDFRRTAVRNLERAGVPRSVAMKLTGHKTEAIYRRYAIVSPGDLNAGVEKLARLHEMLEVKVEVPADSPKFAVSPGVPTEGNIS
jgi:integrase